MENNFKLFKISILESQLLQIYQWTSDYPTLNLFKLDLRHTIPKDTYVYTYIHMYKREIKHKREHKHRNISIPIIWRDI